MPIDLPDIAAEAAAIERELADRQALLPTVPNPNPKIDILTRGSARVGAIGLPITVIYVPDKRLIASGGLAGFAKSFQPEGETLEARAVSLLREISDELVPRWIQLRLGEGDHRVLMEDRQPKWTNDPLLSRIEAF